MILLKNMLLLLKHVTFTYKLKLIIPYNLESFEIINQTCLHAHGSLWLLSSSRIFICRSQAKAVQPLDGSIEIVATFLERSLQDLKLQLI